MLISPKQMPPPLSSSCLFGPNVKHGQGCTGPTTPPLRRRRHFLLHTRGGGGSATAGSATAGSAAAGIAAAGSDAAGSDAVGSDAAGSAAAVPNPPNPMQDRLPQRVPSLRPARARPPSAHKDRNLIVINGLDLRRNGLAELPHGKVGDVVPKGILEGGTDSDDQVDHKVQYRNENGGVPSQRGGPRQRRHSEEDDEDDVE
mmetsp:Transcript_23891/g.51093  ORF Transcript_23891/g.51093 Transcript_23891/m.51093 type:complete len:201 (+) Transcript_23891:139-741(+)